VTERKRETKHKWKRAIDKRESHREDRQRKRDTENKFPIYLPYHKHRCLWYGRTTTNHTYKGFPEYMLRQIHSEQCQMQENTS